LPGVPESELDKLFDRLYRVEASRNRESGGAGLGLAICRNIVDAHAGTISAHPAPLGGVLIRVTLPIAGECQ
jgi:two-component system sensor histidine kinase BaeS